MQMLAAANLIFLDIEMGCLHPDASLLEIGIIKDVPMINNVKVEASCRIRIKPDNGLYIVGAEGLAVNNINLVDHDKSAMTTKAAGTLLYETLKDWSADGTKKLTCVGLGIHSDVDRICRTVISRGTWNHFVNYDLIEIGSIVKCLIMTGKLPRGTSTSLSGLVDFYNLPKDNEFHSALADAQYSKDIFEKLLLEL